LSRAAVLLLVLVAIAAGAELPQSLTPRLESERLRVSAPRLRFLTGEPLERLQNGASVTYEFELTVRSERNGRTLGSVRQRYVVSYDLWEEKFAITRLEPGPRSVSHLSAAAAEAWCIDNISLPTTGLAPDRPFWIRLEFRAEAAADTGQQSEETGFTLSGLIDIFSKKGPDEQLHGYSEAGPFLLAELRKLH
jgi:hypothetical protein